LEIELGENGVRGVPVEGKRTKTTTRRKRELKLQWNTRRPFTQLTESQGAGEEENQTAKKSGGKVGYTDQSRGGGGS